LPMRFRVEKPVDSTTLQSLHYGPTVYSLVHDGSRFPRLSLYGLMDLSGNIEGAVKWDDHQIVIGSQEFDPLYSGNDILYSMYFERDERNVVFAGRDSGVANPSKSSGGSLLDEVWEAAPFSNRNEFLDRVRSVSQAYVAQGLLSARNRQRILLAASQARLEGGK